MHWTSSVLIVKARDYSRKKNIDHISIHNSTFPLNVRVKTGCVSNPFMKTMQANNNCSSIPIFAT